MGLLNDIGHLAVMDYGHFKGSGNVNRAIGDPFGVAAAQDAAKANQANLSKIGGLYGAATNQYVMDQGAALARQRKVTQGLRDTTKTGLLNLASQGDTARQGILDRSNEQLATAQSGLEGRGVISATLSDALRRSNNYDVNQSLNGIDEAISRLAAEFQTQGAGAVAASGSQEAGILGQIGAGRAGLTQNYMGILGGVQHEPGVTPGQQALQLLATLYGAKGKV